ncbi:hypothetical protein KR044_002953 [Drosophila immigrans]|nr:hypothetical protein KR044_002953 [Drosophila immigrans]
MDSDNKKLPDDQQMQQPESSSNAENVLQLLDGQVGETETDLPIELPTSTSLQGVLQHRNLHEAKALVKDMIESLLPNTEPEPFHKSSSSTLTSVAKAPIGYDDERLHRILRLLDRYTRNLEAIEELVLKTSRKATAQETPVPKKTDTSVQLRHHFELATQTIPHRTATRFGTIRPQNGRQISQQPEQQQTQQSHQQTEVMPPCERRQHIITISANNSTPFATPPPPRTFMGRIGRTLGEFAGALCLCLQCQFFDSLLLSHHQPDYFARKSANRRNTDVFIGKRYGNIALKWWLLLHLQ